MKQVLYITLLITLTNCKTIQPIEYYKINNNFLKDTIMFEKFDFELYKKYKKSIEKQYPYVLPNGNLLVSFDMDEKWGGHRTELVNKYPYYVYLRRYHPNGYIKEKCTIVAETLRIGKTYHYNTEGRLYLTEDEDEKFKGCKIQLDFVLKFVESKGFINLKTGEGWWDFDKGFNFRIAFTSENGKKYWIVVKEDIIPFDMRIHKPPKIGSPRGYFDMIWYIDAMTGEVEERPEDMRYRRIQPITEKKPEPEPITYRGKSYTEEEWKIFEEQEYQKYVANKNKKGFWDKLFGD